MAIMANFNSLQLPSFVRAGSYSMTIANIGGDWLSHVQTFLQAASPPQYTAVADFVRLSEGYTIISGSETKQFDCRVGLWSQGWKALANYNWFFAAQNTTVASFGTIEATVWGLTNAEELVYWFCMQGLAIRAVIKEKQSSGGVGWLLPAASVAGAQSMPSHSARESELAKWIGKLESLSTLAPGWNRQGAPAPSEKAIRTAREFIEALVNDGQPPTRVAASAVGGVGVTRQIGERIAYFEFYNDGAACALLADDAAEERVLDVAPERGSFTSLLHEVKAYLNG
jgi:hypothetical protein